MRTLVIWAPFVTFSAIGIVAVITVARGHVDPPAALWAALAGGAALWFVAAQLAPYL